MLKPPEQVYCEVGKESSMVGKKKERQELLYYEAGKEMNYEVGRDTRLYVDHGPEGVSATMAQKYKLPEQHRPVWRPVNHTSRALTAAEKNYGKSEGESLAILSGILSNKMFLYGTDFEVVTDHEPLCPMYNSPSKPLPVRVAKHKSKLRGFSFKVTYEPGSTNPSDYGEGRVGCGGGEGGHGDHCE